MSYWKLRSIALGKKQGGRLQNGEIEMTQDKGQVPAIQRFEVVDCIDSTHVPAVIPKPHGPSVAVALSDDLRDRLVAISEAIADQDDLAAQAMLREILKAPQPSPTPQAPFQQRVQPWLLECFGAEIAADRMERNHRFLEESLELVQSLGCTAREAHQLVGYVFGRPVGDPPQEVGGVMVTLAALCLASGLDMHDAGEVELVRISVPEIVAKIRAKQAAKPKHSPLPQSPPPQADSQPAPVEVADAMADSQYLAGVSAGWNAANADDPNAALQKLHESRAGYLKPLRAGRATADSVLGDALSDAVRVPLDSLHADAAYLIGRLRDGSMPYARVIEIIRERIDAAKAAIRASAGRATAESVPAPAGNVVRSSKHKETE